MSDEELSKSSSSSSFVPVDRRQLNDAIQIINEDKIFNNQILDYINKTSPSDVGNNYHIISVFGSQSTGKSTLLNKLFNTNFDVMDELNRQQTTKGIWLAYSPVVSTNSGHTSSKSNILVMDVEGTDGRERGEDQDFERKAALFALSTSEILIINIWETQIGLYQGANMGLLKTVFEVNLTLFGKAKLDTTKKNDHKVLLLFVIRDHIGVTPIESLAQTLKADLVNMWNNLAKPNELAHLQFDDFFDINFHALNHKVLQPKEFEQGINNLGDRLIVNNELFRLEYHHNIPIDGWTLYAEKCWEQIENNKDLDLPTQQILVAQFKCDEIVDHEFNEFLIKFQEFFKEIKEDPDHEQLGLLFIDLRNDILENYDQDASKYNSIVYEQRRNKLKSLMNEKFKEIFYVYSKQLINKSLVQFQKDLVDLKGIDFHNKQQAIAAKLIEDIILNLGFISLQGDIPTNDITTTLKKDMDEIISIQQKIELNNIVNKSSKKLSNNLSKFIQSEIPNVTENTWNNILEHFNKLVSEFTEKYSYGFDLGTTDEENEMAISKFKFKSWNQFYGILHKLITEEKLLVLLQDRFDDKFRYDENGLPKLYQDSTELEKTFSDAKEYALKILPTLTIAKLNDDSEIIPEYDIFNQELRRKYLGVIEDEDDEDEGERCFAEIINEQDKSTILTKFKKEIDAKFVETKRSIVQHITSIPYYIYIIIILLGWNEFMAVIRNPFFFSLLILIGASLYILYTMNLLKPAMVVAQRMIDEVIVVAKEKLREVLIDDHAAQARNLAKIAGNKPEDEGEEIELQEVNR
ncbi:unnamed protein product [Candida verbasci]|uniref:GB1/RHD3-type G domain-containing protein n=1 Tax=Candida verbasci TaxID=1227364 RepID=A0A9W4TUR5_9ASCO|nr:unnamed protein product [Candida verbasci]